MSTKTHSKGNSKTTIVPLGDRVLVRPMTQEETEKKHNFGLIIPDTITKEKSGQGEVLAVGEGKYIDGKLIPLAVKVGDRVIYSKYAYEEVKIDGQELYLLSESQIFARIKN